jgi:hypothetical protein
MPCSLLKRNIVAICHDEKPGIQALAVNDIRGQPPVRVSIPVTSVNLSGHDAVKPLPYGRGSVTR